MTSPQHLAYVLRLADNALILGQRNSEWTGHGPILEEDIALANLSLDLIGQARLLYGRAAKLEASGHGAVAANRNEDDYAYFRTEHEFRNYTLVELPNFGPWVGTARPERDYAVTIVRNFLYSTLMLHLWEALTRSNDQELAAIAAKSLKEVRYHRHHTRDWLVRFGDGTDESHRRAQTAVDFLLPYTSEFFSSDPVEQRVAADGVAPLTATLRPAWRADVRVAFDEATLALSPMGRHRTTGKYGEHSEHMGFLLAEMQGLARQHPGASW
jgi:ring-1,2-phenylacetyl-CoA epoxidase subunit PaaC